MMMLKGGICMIILLLGPLFMTGWGLAEAIGPTPRGLHGFHKRLALACADV